MRVSRGGFLSPAVRRLLAEHGLRASQVIGTGAGGRITRRDVEATVQERRDALAAAPLPPDEADGFDAPPPDPGKVETPEAIDDVEAEELDTVEAAATDEGEEVEPVEEPAEEEAVVDEDAEDDAAEEAATEELEPIDLHVDSDSGVLAAAAAGIEAEAAPSEEPKPTESSPAPVAPETEPAAAGSLPVSPWARETLVPFTPMRRLIAENLKASRATAAHAFCAVEADFDRVDRVRLAHRESWREQEGFSLTYLPFVARAVVTALAEFPHLNASVRDDALLVHHDVHLGIAVDLEFEGLIVPVIRDASAKTFREIAREIRRLAELARAGRLRPDDIAAGTFTITNPGPSGTLLSVPIINQPQVGILATDTVRRRPVVLSTADGSEGIAVHPVGLLGLSFDHRAVDGLYATSFVSRVKEVLEASDWEQELAQGAT